MKPLLLLALLGTASAYADFDFQQAIDKARLEIEDNIVAVNEKGVVGFSAKKGKAPSLSINGKNLVYGNQIESENVDLPTKTIKDDPKFKEVDSGLFSSETEGMGLEDPATLQSLWNKWQAELDRH